VRSDRGGGVMDLSLLTRGQYTSWIRFEAFSLGNEA
jgi:hypothetical protein